MQVIDLSTIEEAIAFTEKLKTGVIDDLQAQEIDLQFSGELSRVSITIEGPSYHGTVPGDLAKGIWDYQLELYRAGAYALYGVADTRKLTKEQRQQLELVFDVSPGSSKLVAEIKETFECLKSLFDGMNGTQKLLAIVLVTAILTGGYTYIHHSDNQKAVVLEQERTKQGETIKNTATGVLQIHKIAEKYSQANESGLISIAKSASDATCIKLGKSTLNEEAIRDINRKSDRTKATAEYIDGPFMVYEMNGKDHQKTGAILCDPSGREFPVFLDDIEFSRGKIDSLWEAASKRKPINLEVTVTVLPDGTIRKAQLVAIN